MKYKDPVTGEMKTLSVKAADTLPIGTIVDYDGDTVPDGWEQIVEPGSFIVFGLDNSFSWSRTDEWGNFPFNTLQRKSGDDFIEIDSNTSVYKIIADIKKLRVSARICFSPQSASLYWLMLQLYKNNVGIAKSITGLKNTVNAWYELTLTTVLEVEKNDILKLPVMKDSEGSMLFDPLNNNSTWGVGNACEVVFEVIE